MSSWHTNLSQVCLEVYLSLKTHEHQYKLYILMPFTTSAPYTRKCEQYTTAAMLDVYSNLFEFCFKCTLIISDVKIWLVQILSQQHSWFKPIIIIIIGSFTQNLVQLSLHRLSKSISVVYVKMSFYTKLISWNTENKITQFVPECRDI